MLAGLLCSLYLILFVLGVSSNVSAFVRTVRVYRWVRKCEWSSDPQAAFMIHGSGIARVKHLIWLTIILVITNLTLLLCLCFLISDVLAQGWHLGSALCWYYWWSENVAKTFVAFMLSALSIERYLHSLDESKWKSLANSSLTVPILVIFGLVTVVVLAAPLQPYVGVQTLIIDSATAGFDAMNLTKCGISEYIPKWSLRYHVLGSFAVAYALPVLISFFCYVAIAKNSKSSLTEGNQPAAVAYQGDRFPSLSSTSTAASANTETEPLSKRVTVISAALAGLYLLCWSPYWLTTLMIQFGNLSHASAFTLPFTLFVCHVLPYVNAMAAGLLFLTLAKRLKLLKLSDMVSGGGGGNEQAAGGNGKANYEMAARESLASSDE